MHAQVYNHIVKAKTKKKEIFFFLLPVNFTHTLIGYSCALVHTITVTRRIPISQTIIQIQNSLTIFSPLLLDSHDVSARGTFGSPINARVVVVVVVRMDGSWSTVLDAMDKKKCYEIK